METILIFLSNAVLFWLAWVVIPLVMEIIPAIAGFFILIVQHARRKKSDKPIKLPEITVIIPVYNSSQTLEGCLRSVAESNYPLEAISVMLINNCSRDDSFDVFAHCQERFPQLYMQWMNARQGKSKALNLALYNSRGKYIINIDSDGELHPDALKNIVERFEQYPDVNAVTGVVLINPEQIEETRGFFFRLLRRTEFFEYCQAFLAGRNLQSSFNSIYTLSGACSAFRRSVILKTQMYNTETVGEDTQITFQIRRLLKKKIHLCENAFFFVDPIEGVNKLYTQRQRWQQGELEVSHLFFDQNRRSPLSFFSDFMIRILSYDHTFVFPRMIWYFALICLTYMKHPLYELVGSVLIMYGLYVLTTFLNYINVNLYLSAEKKLCRYYRAKWYLIFLFPLYNFLMFWVRLAGIINSSKSERAWKTSTLPEEGGRFLSVLRGDLLVFTHLFRSAGAERQTRNNG
jgi:putative glycosyltransferase TIGR03111